MTETPIETPALTKRHLDMLAAYRAYEDDTDAPSPPHDIAIGHGLYLLSLIETISDRTSAGRLPNEPASDASPWQWRMRISDKGRRALEQWQR